MDELQRVKKYIDELDFSMIIDKMCRYLGWRRKDAHRVCELYRRFLWLNRKYPHLRPLPPSEEIDEFWHNHILDTQKYRYDCQQIFGQYFDHYPYFGIDKKSSFADLENAFANMLALYQEEFKESLYCARGITSSLVSLVKYRLRRTPKKVAI